MKKILKFILDFSDKNHLQSIGLLILRVVASLSLMTHGYGKLIRFEERSATFMSHLSLGSEVSLSLVIFAEFICPIFILLGIGTRIFSIPIIYTFIIIVFDIHIDDPFSKMEKGILFLTIYSTIFLSGPGNFSIDSFLKKKLKIKN